MPPTASQPAGKETALQAAPDAALARLGGAGALLAGALFLLSLVYVYGVLAQAGLNVEMFDDQARLLPWVAEHARAYTGLWWLTLLSTLALLPAPLALHDRLRHGAGGVSRVAAVAGIGGVIFGLAAPLVLAAASPVLAQGYVDASRQAPEVGPEHPLAAQGLTTTGDVCITVQIP